MQANLETWQPELFERSLLHRDLAALLPLHDWRDWPTTMQLNALLPAGACSYTGAPLCFVEQPALCNVAAVSYEERIALRGEIATRAHCWHDVFNALIWALFPRAKAQLNALHVAEAQAHGRVRTRHRDALTLLDECGVLMVSSDDVHMARHRAHSWQDLFCAGRDAWGRSLSALIIGHGLYEQCVNPYIGLTAKALYLPVHPHWFSLSLKDRYRQADLALAAYLTDAATSFLPARLLPFPVLGVPGWDARNADPAFYSNERYFRPARQT